MNLANDTCYDAIANHDARFDGRFFIGVRTTGIYCRPICRARMPKRENMRFFPSAAAAEAAGFRSCLQCRPEYAPEISMRPEYPELVTRGLALIADTEIGLDPTARLAADLEVDEIHLRALFDQHIGASPQALLQTRGVLLAKQLITDTAMSMCEIARATGFAKVEHFDARFRALYKRPPQALRRESKRAVRERLSDCGLAIMLPYRAPYDWLMMSRFLAARAIPGVESVDDEGRYHRSIALGAKVGTVCVAPYRGANCLQVTIQFPDVAYLATIVNRLRRVFDVAADPWAIATHLGLDRVLKPLVDLRPGLRLPGAWDGFELAVRGILGQQITVGAATNLAGKLVAAYGIPLPTPSGPITHVFPSAARIAAADLRTLGMPSARARALSMIAAAFVTDPRLFSPGQTLLGAVARYCALPGIGEWTAQYIAMRGLSHPDALPVGDIGLMRALADAAGRRPTPAELLARAEGWRPWRAYATVHLWMSGSTSKRPTPVSPNGHAHAPISA